MRGVWWEVQDQKNSDKAQGEEELRTTFPMQGLQQEF